MLKQFGALLAWFSGSVAGISAVLYALGFIATIAADRVLGVGLEFASRDPVSYIARGGSIIMRTVIISMWAVLAVIAVTAAIRWVYVKLGLAERAWLGTARRWAGAAAAPIASLTMIVLAVAGLAYYVLPALDVGGLLFAGPMSDDDWAGKSDLEKAVLSQNHPALRTWFNKFAICVGLVAGLGLIARSRLVKEVQRIWLILASVAGFLALVGAPIAYGALVVQTSAPDVWIDPPPGDGVAGMRLLSRSDGGVLVWLEDQRKVRWINASRIDVLTVGPGRPIETIFCSETNASICSKTSAPLEGE